MNRLSTLPDECWKAVSEGCQRLGLTQIELARRAGDDLSTLNWFENGRQHIKPSTLAKIEEALAAAEAGTRTTEVLRAQANLARGSARPSNSLIPPPEGTPERAEWDEDFRLRLLYSDHTYVRMQFARLRWENARWSEHIKVLEKMNALLQQQIETYQKITEMDEEHAVITAAAIAALEKSVPQKSPEAKSLLR